MNNALTAAIKSAIRSYRARDAAAALDAAERAGRAWDAYGVPEEHADRVALAAYAIRFADETSRLSAAASIALRDMSPARVAALVARVALSGATVNEMVDATSAALAGVRA